MDSWTLWRLLKFVALALFAGGVLGVVRAPARKTRLALAFGSMLPGFVLSWLAGWMLMVERGLSQDAPWIQVGLLASGVALSATFAGSHRERVHPLVSVLAVGGLIGSIAAMVLRTDAWSELGIAMVASLAVGALLSLPLRSRQLDLAPTDLHAAWRGFQIVAWAEGASLLLMLGISMPLRKLTGIDLDGDSGLIGWLHGVMVLVFIQALVTARRTFGWSWGRFALGFVASLLPAGTFIWERWLVRQGAAPAHDAQSNK